MVDYAKELNKDQFEAVTSKDQYLRIIAGAGSGKTRVLTYRIAYLIEFEHISPYNILAITFTNKVAKEMKERVINLIEDQSTSRLSISTFHSFCATFLRKEIGVLGITSSFLIIDDVDQENIIKNIAADHGYKKNDDIVKHTLDFISRNKTKGKLPGDLNVDKLTEEDKKLFNFYVEYERIKSFNAALDFDDLLIYTVLILKSYPEIKEKYNNRFKHVLVDEFQDTNDLQFELLTLICGLNTSLYVVGDPDQTIYTWRGANLKIILDIEKYFYPLTTIVLNQNYRSTTTILNSANSLIKNNAERYPKDLYTSNGKGREIVLKSYDNGIKEGEGVAKNIIEIRQRTPDFKNSDVAVLYRSSYLSLDVEKALMRANIPYNVYGGVKFYNRKEVKDALAYFRLIANEDDDISFDRIVNVPSRKIGDVSVATLKHEASKANMSMVKYLRNIKDYDTELRGAVVGSLLEMIQAIDEVRPKILAKNENNPAELNYFLRKIGYYDYLEEKEETIDKVANVVRLVEDLEDQFKRDKDYTLEKYLEEVALSSGQDEVDSTDKVKLMTVHTAKGLEFNYVFIIGMNEGVFPNYRSLSKTKYEEERRLAYVAMTRAKKELYISYHRGHIYATGVESGMPSSFIKEAGLKVQTFSFKTQNYNNANTDRKYRFDLDDPYNLKKVKPKPNVIDLSYYTGLTWKVGDTCVHKTFGLGKVIEVKEDDIIVVDFISFGVKTLLGRHPALSKGDNQA